MKRMIIAAPQGVACGIAIALVGCQYVSAVDCVFPRLGRDGRPMCKAMQ